MNNIYWTIVTRNGWREFHVSAVKAEVETLQALSRKTPVVSKFAASNEAEWRAEMQAYGKHAIEVIITDSIADVMKKKFGL